MPSTAALIRGSSLGSFSRDDHTVRTKRPGLSKRKSRASHFPDRMIQPRVLELTNNVAIIFTQQVFKQKVPVGVCRVRV